MSVVRSETQRWAIRAATGDAKEGRGGAKEVSDGARGLIPSRRNSFRCNSIADERRVFTVHALNLTAKSD